MSIQQYISNMKEIQQKLLAFLEDSQNIEGYYEEIIQFFYDLKIQQDQKMLKSFLHLLTNISTNHYRVPNFYKKIEQIILFLSKSIKENFTNFEIFKIFQKDKNIILFLINEKILTFDQLLVDKMCCFKLLTKKYPHFFAPEIKPFINRDNLIKIIFTEMIDENSIKKYTPEISYCDITSDQLKYIDELIQYISNSSQNIFVKKRSIGENDKYICELIRKDKIEEFKIFVEKESVSFNEIIDSSIYETNPLLIQNKVTLIEYAAFFGSIQIFNYLLKNNADLTPSLWIYGIHSGNQKIIKILKEKNVLLNDNSYNECIKESIKCHHIDLANYFIAELSKTDGFSKKQKNMDDEIISHCFHYYNFLSLSQNFDKQESFYYACKYDHYQIVEYYLENRDINANEKLILNYGLIKFTLFQFEKVLILIIFR